MGLLQSFPENLLFLITITSLPEDAEPASRQQRADRRRARDEPPRKTGKPTRRKRKKGR